MSNLYGAADDTGASRGLSDFALQLRSVDVKTWEQFYVSIAGTHPIIDEDVVEENTGQLKAARFRTDDSLDEPSLQAMLPVLLPIVKYVIEDTHATVRNYAARKLDNNGKETYETDRNGVVSQRCAFARSDGVALRPDFTV